MKHSRTWNSRKSAVIVWSVNYQHPDWFGGNISDARSAPHHNNKPRNIHKEWKTSYVTQALDHWPHHTPTQGVPLSGWGRGGSTRSARLMFRPWWRSGQWRAQPCEQSLHQPQRRTWRGQRAQVEELKRGMNDEQILLFTTNGGLAISAFVTVDTYIHRLEPLYPVSKRSEF